jgi:hypothetical protein
VGHALDRRWSAGRSFICALIFERIHLLTLVFGASLIGVAQDYGIYHWCHRSANGRSIQRATAITAGIAADADNDLDRLLGSGADAFSACSKWPCFLWRVLFALG